MTILYPERFKQARPANYDGVFDWDWLESAFAGKIKPMDIDAIIERKGFFLCFETKADNIKIPFGQKLLFTQLIKLQPERITLFILRGKTKATIHGLTIWGYTKKKQFYKREYPEADGEFVWQQANKWFMWADGTRNK